MIKGKYLCPTSSVLSGTSSNQFRIMVLEKLFIETHVLLLREDSIVVLQAVLLQESSITICLNQ